MRFLGLTISAALFASQAHADESCSALAFRLSELGESIEVQMEEVFDLSSTIPGRIDYLKRNPEVASQELRAHNAFIIASDEINENLDALLKVVHLICSAQAMD